MFKMGYIFALPLSLYKYGNETSAADAVAIIFESRASLKCYKHVFLCMHIYTFKMLIEIYIVLFLSLQFSIKSERVQ